MNTTSGGNLTSVLVNKRSLSSLSLAAARELDAMISSNSGMPAKATSLLAQELRHLFPGDRPNLPPESIGLVCGVVDDWTVADDLGYDKSTKNAREIASLLEKDHPTKQELERLVRFCLSLYYATQAHPLIHDIPEDHEGFLSMC